MKIPKKIEDKFFQWSNFLENNIEFWLKESEIHTKNHCKRVLLFSLLIADEMNLSESEKDILAMASVFHDSRRKDDGFDVGHGKRAANYYRHYCGNSNLKYEQRTYDAICFHDIDDEIGIEKINEKNSKEHNSVLLYKIFKDSDALDRFRLGPSGLDIRYLRTKEAIGLYDYAKNIWEENRSLL